MARHEAYQGLARKWRPQRFEDLVGQESLAQAMQNALTSGRIPHGHLLTGPRGIGKTTSARIIARAVNCDKGPTPTPCGVCRHCIDIAAGSDLDVIEFDAASNTGVDDMRDLLERVVQSPFSARYKVYIIDEVHMLSIGAFNALLKTLEEPPPHVIFIFATTEFEKVPETVRSRCIVHKLRRLTAEDIIRRLSQVAAGEGIALDPAVAREVFGLIARSVEGGMRDALVIFDQLLALSNGKPDAEAAIRLLGLADQSALARTVEWLAQGNAGELLRLIEELVDRGRSLERFVKGLIAYLRDLMLLQAGAEEKLIELTGDALAEARKLAAALAPATLFNILNHLFELEEKLKTSTQARFLIEFTFLRLAAIKPVVPIDEMIKRISALPEATVAAAVSGSPAEPTPPQRSTPVKADASEPAATKSASTRTTSRSTATRAAAGAVMFDSAPSVLTAAPAGLATPLGEALPATTAEVLDRLLPLLPDASRPFLSRYLRQAVALRLTPAALCIEWASETEMGRRMIEKPDNQRMIEAALREWLGRPIRVTQHTSTEACADPAEPVAAPSAKTPVTSAAHIMADSLPADDAPIEEYVYAEESAPVEDEAAAPLEVAASFLADEPPGESAAPVPLAAVDTRSAAERAQALLAKPEGKRRMKLIRDMFNGRLIDERGEPLQV